MGYEDFASIDLNDVEEFISTNWMYSMRLRADQDDVSDEMTIQPNAGTKMRVRKAHHAARIKAGLITSRADLA